MQGKFVGGIAIMLSLGLLIFGSILLLSSCDTADMVENQEESKMLMFTSPVEPGQLIALVESLDLKTEEIQFKAGEITAGYTLQSDNLDHEIQNALSVHVENMSKILQITESDNDISSLNFRQEIQE